MTKEEFDRIKTLFSNQMVTEEVLSLIKNLKNESMAICQSGDSIMLPKSLVPEIKEYIIQLLERELNKINTEIANV